MTPAAARPRHRAEVVIAAAAGAVAVLGWVLAERDPDDLGRPIAVIGGAFLLASVVSAVIRCVTQPGGPTSTLRSLGTTSSSGPTGSRTETLCLPGRPVWLLPVAVLPVMAATLPIGFHRTPGDWSIVGVMILVAIGLGYVAIGVGVVAWLVVVLPLVLLGRSVLGRFAGHPLTRAERIGTWVAGLLLTVAVAATAVTLAYVPPPGTRTGLHRSLHLPELVGLGDQSSPWWWLARAAVLGLVAEVVALRRLGGTRRRPRSHDQVS